MSKYTELLSEYLQDNDLPEIFNEIEGISDLFIMRYCDREIGYETEALFAMKLEYIAQTWTPIYKTRIEEIENIIGKWEDAKKTRSKTGQIKRTYGEQNNSQYNLPANGVLPFTPSQNVPNNTNVNAEHIDTEEYPEYEEIETGYTGAEYDAHIESLEKDITSLKEKFLDKFEKIFMQVF